MKIARVMGFVAAALVGTGAQALDLRPAGVFVEGGVAERASYSLTAGVSWPWAWRRQGPAGELSGYTEGFVSHWNARAPGGRESLTQIGMLPMVRNRFGSGASDWFVEAGIGVSFTDRLYTTTAKRFSTRFNFIDVIGVGRSFGAGRQQEVTLRITHLSNAGIRRPNPGENFLQLRYSTAF